MMIHCRLHKVRDKDIIDELADREASGWGRSYIIRDALRSFFFNSNAVEKPRIAETQIRINLDTNELQENASNKSIDDAIGDTLSSYF